MAMDMLKHGFHYPNLKPHDLVLYSKLSPNNVEHQRWILFITDRHPNIIDSAKRKLDCLIFPCPISGVMDPRSRKPKSKFMNKIKVWEDVLWRNDHINQRHELARVCWAVLHKGLRNPLAVRIAGLPGQPIRLVMAFI